MAVARWWTTTWWNGSGRAPRCSTRNPAGPPPTRTGSRVRLPPSSERLSENSLPSGRRAWISAQTVLRREHGRRPGRGRHDLAADVEQQRPRPGHPGVGLQQGVEAGPLDQQPRQRLLDRPGPLEQHVLLVDQAREQRLGDGDERHLERHLEHREAGPVGGLEHGRRGGLEGEPEPDAERGQLGPGELLDVGGLGLGAAAHAEAGGEQHLPAAQEPGRVHELGHVRPADRPVQPALARDQPQAELVDGQQVGNGGRHGSPLCAETYNSVPGNWTGGHYPRGFHG